MNVTLFGYPKTGKTTLFNLLTGAGIEVGGFGDAKQEPHVRTCAIPDPRLDRIAALYPDRKKVEASFDLSDLVGISYGEVKASLLLGHLRTADALVHVVRAFHDEGIPHPKGRIDPAEDIRVMEEELVIADLVLVENRRERLDKDLKKAKDPEGEREKDLIDRLHPFLESGKGVRDLDLSPTEEKLLRSFAFLSLKPLLHIVNMDEKDTRSLSDPSGRLGIGPEGGPRVLAFCGKIESEIGELENGEKKIFMNEYGIREPVTSRFLGQALDFQDRISFFTVGKDEVRAWAVRKDSTALKAAGAVHTDIEKGFIRAEVISWEDLLAQGSLQKAKESGAIRLEGKDYPVRDGDVIYFRFGQ
jgi:GTP-binding protein YchF